MEMSSVAYIMQWGEHRRHVHSHLRLLFEEQKFVDLTLFCSTHSVKVHSVVIASNSSYFEKVLLSQNGVNSVIVLKDMKFEVLRALIEFMYCGETTVLDEDVDALLYASKKFEVKGLSRMTRQGVMFSAADKMESDGIDTNHRFIFPAESAQPGMIQAVINLTKNTENVQTLENNKLDSLYFKKTVFQRRGRPHKKHGNVGFPEAAMSDTEYAILKEAEESRKALEKLQNYVLGPEREGGSAETPETEERRRDGRLEEKSLDHSYSNSRRSGRSDVAGETGQTDGLATSLLPTDVPIFVDDGNGNYVTLDVEMANMIAGQEIKYNLVQGVVMTSDDKGSQHSNPASILIPETQFQTETLPILNYGQGIAPKPDADLSPETDLSSEEFLRRKTETEETMRNGKTLAKRKPFVVKEIIQLKQSKKMSSNTKIPEVDESLMKFENSGILF